MAEEQDNWPAVGLALRVAVASSICLVISGWFQLSQPALSVYTAQLIMSLFPISSFQKGVERFLGRTLGILYGLFLIWYFLNVPFLYMALIIVGEIGACYVYLSGRLAYAALMAAIFVGVMGAIGATSPSTSWNYASYAILQLLIGEAVAYIVNYLTGVERTLAISTEGQPLWPLRVSWINTAAMLGFGQVATMLATLYLDLPVTATMISAMIIGITPGGLTAHWTKAWQRALGAGLGGLYVMASIVLLAHMPNFPLMVALVFLAMFLAAYFTKTSKKNSYVFLQMGMVVPMVLIGENVELGSIDKAIQRMIGVGVGLVVASFVSIIWPHADITTTAAPTSTPRSSPSPAAIAN
jgi:uncharacterized membrane protein YgaE (UPF0421/DUF939 family)